MKIKPWPGAQKGVCNRYSEVKGASCQQGHFAAKPAVHNARHASEVGDVLLCSLLTVRVDPLSYRFSWATQSSYLEGVGCDLELLT